MLIEMQTGSSNLEKPCSKNTNPIFDITDAILKLYLRYILLVRRPDQKEIMNPAGNE